MKNTYKITLIVKNEKVESLNLSKKESNLFTRLFEEREIDNLDIRLISRRRKSFGYYFVDFESTNNKTIEDNLNNYYKKLIEIEKKEIEKRLDFKKSIIKELEELEIEDVYYA